MTDTHYGAYPADWIQFDLLLGLTEDLLPVVSNPKAIISGKSSIKTLGKTPTHYTKNRRVVGIGAWTVKEATHNEISIWSKVKDYGICLQTRNVRALDVDVEDRELSSKIIEFILLAIPTLPKRFRNNTGKCLFAFRVAGSFPKRVLQVEGGIIEFLGNGQQFIACGTHTSGERYEWDWNDNDDFPTLSPEEFERLWESLVREFGTADASMGKIRKKGPTVKVDDPLVDKLTVLSKGNDGRLHIECPFKVEHTMDSGVTQTAYYPAGTNGYDMGHFKCLHAHCAKRSDDEFTEALGLGSVADDFEVVEEKENTGNVVKTKPLLPKLIRNKAGEILSTIGNVQAILLSPHACGEHIVFDTFKDEILYAPVDDPRGWRQFTDNDYTRLRIHLEENGFRPISRDMMSDVIYNVAHINKFDTAIEWFNTIPKWDGTPRVDAFLTTYMGAADSPYTRALSSYTWTALAGRILVPGIKADMVPIWEGEQGAGKSTLVKAMVPSTVFYNEVSLSEKDDDLSRKMRGKIVIELSEIRMNHKDMEWLKAFASRQDENWRPLYKEFHVTFPRRMLLIGTTNDKEFLYDGTGNRRWLPIHVTKADITGVERDRLQLWAEAKVLFEKNGINWEVEKLANDTHRDYSLIDPWQPYVEDWMNTVDNIDGKCPMDAGYIRVADVLRYALQIDAKSLKGSESKRVSKILRGLNFESVTRRFEDRVERVWIKSEWDFC